VAKSDSSTYFERRQPLSKAFSLIKPCPSRILKTAKADTSKNAVLVLTSVFTKDFMLEDLVTA
jgi:hypothetical protein